MYLPTTALNIECHNMSLNGINKIYNTLVLNMLKWDLNIKIIKTFLVKTTTKQYKICPV